MGHESPTTTRTREDLNEDAKDIVDNYYQTMAYLAEAETLNLDLPWGTDFHEHWVATGNTTSVHNDMLHTASLLSIVSRALFHTRFTSLQNNTEIPVIHTLSIQKSGSGKSPALKYAGQMANASGFDYRSQTTLTEAGLIGGVRDGDVVAGLAAHKDVIGFDESRTLFKLAKNEGKGTFGEMLNQVLDFRHIHKDLATGTIDYDPKPAFIGISYPPSDMDLEFFMESGLLSRFFILYRSFGLEDYRKVADELMEGFMGANAQDFQEVTRPTGLINYVRDTLRMDLEYLQYNTQELVERQAKMATIIRAIRAHYPEGFRFGTEQVPSQKERLERTIFGKLEEVSEPLQTVLEPDLTRMHVQWMRLACVFAALDYGSPIIKKEHMLLATSLLERVWDSRVTFFQRFHQQQEIDSPTWTFKQSHQDIIKALIHENSLTQQELEEKAGVSGETIRKERDLLVAKGWIQYEEDGRTKRYRLAIDE